MIGRILFSSSALVVAAAAVAAVVLFPWTPAKPNSYGLDPSLVYVDTTSGGAVSIHAGQAVMTTAPGSFASINAVTTLDDFQASMDVTVNSDSLPSATDPSASAFEELLWFPASGTSISIRFVSSPTREIIGAASDGAQDSLVHVLGPYQLGTTYRVLVDWKKGSQGTFHVVSPGGQSSVYTVGRSSGLGLFGDRFVNFTLQSGQGAGQQEVRVQHFALAIPAQTTFAAKASDWRLIVVTILIGLWFCAFVAYHALPTLRRRLAEGRQRLRIGSRRVRAAALVGVAGAVLLGVYAVIGQIDAHPYDRLAQEGYAYVSQAYGLTALYERTDYTPDAAVRGGHQSWSSPPFAYPPVMAYPYWAIGQLWHATGGVIVPLGNRAFEVFWKLGFALFLLVDAGVLYLLYRRDRGSRAALVAALLLVVNPALVFDAMVWGETEAILLAALLTAVFGFVTGRSRLGWSALVIATLIKQTALFALPILAVYSWRKYGWRRTAVDGCWGVLVGWVAVAPLIFVGYSPSTIYRSMVSQIVNFANPLPGNASSDTFSLWTLVNGFHGLHGFSRIWAPYPLTFAVGNLAFSTAGTLLFALCLIFILVSLGRGTSRVSSEQLLYLYLAGAFTAYVMLSTLASARYLLLALPFLMLGVANSRLVKQALMIGGLTVISFLSMYGILMQIAVDGEWPVYFGLGNPATNSLSKLVYSLYTSDVVITFLGIGLIGLVAVLLTSDAGPSVREALTSKRELALNDSRR